MRKIAVLDKHTIDKIAAGEVIERPSSVVKELVENSIDAGATAVTVEITDGGKKLIRITDNGSGIEADQVSTAFLSHATSKIEKVEDLENIASLGFRGEALSSIAAVSQVELITKTPSALTGMRYLIEGGEEQKAEEMGAPEGTTFLIRNLFFNTPARSKFLKSDMTEANYIAVLMEQLALSHPEISFKYIQNKQVKLHTSGNYSVKDVIYNIYGRDIAKALLPISYENDFMKMEGFAGKPEISRGNRSFENYYINGRYVKNNLITKAIEDAYKGLVMQHKFPFVSLHIQMTGNDLDVNVHPRKREVRFARTTEVYDAVYEAVRNALTHRELIPVVPVGREETSRKEAAPKRADIPEPFENRRREQLYPGASRPGQPSMLHETSVYPAVRSSGTSPVSGTRGSGADLSASRSEAGKLTRAEEQLFSAEKKPAAPVPATEKAPEKIPDSSAKPSVSSAKTQSDSVKSPNHSAAAPKVSSESQDTFAKSSVISMKTQDTSATEQNLPEKPPENSAKQEAVPAVQEPQQLELFEEKLLAPESRSRHRLIGQLFDTYWLVEFNQNFYIIDQHAAHEKVYYERFVKRFQEQTMDSQNLNPPIIVTLSLEEEARLHANEKLFRDFGFEIEPFGGREYCISAVPSNLYGFEEGDLFLEMLDHLSGDGQKDTMELFTSRLATMACKAAVKGNHKMSSQEADKLIDELLTLENPYHCPHGRPTVISMTRTEIEKKFKRIV